MKQKAALFFTLLALGNCSYGVIAPNITPIGSGLNPHAEADAGNGLITNDFIASQTTTLNPLTGGASATAFNGALSCMAQTSATATWTSASAGQVQMDTKFVSDNLLAYSSSRVATGSPVWFYTFSSDAPATLTWSQKILFQGSFAFGMRMDIDESIDGSVIREDFFNAPSHGSLSYTIDPNVTYKFQLFDIANLNGLPAFTSEREALFSFQITPVPETNSALLFCELGIIAVCLRNRAVSKRA